MFICMEIPTSATAMLEVIFNSANNLVFLCMEKHNLTFSILQLSYARKKGNNAVSCPHALSHFSEIINFYYEIVTTTIFKSSVSEFSWFIYCLAFSYEESLWKVGFLPFSRATYQEHQSHIALVFGRMQQSSYP